MGPGESFADRCADFTALDHDADLSESQRALTDENLVLLEDPSLGEYLLGRKQLTRLDPWRPTDAQIVARNMMAEREDFLYLDAAAPLYFVPRGLVPPLAHQVNIYVGPPRIWETCKVPFIDSPHTPIGSTLERSSALLREFQALAIDRHGGTLGGLSANLRKEFLGGHLTCLALVADDPLVIGRRLDLDKSVAIQVCGTARADWSAVQDVLLAWELEPRGLVKMRNRPLYFVATTLLPELEADDLEEDLGELSLAVAATVESEILEVIGRCRVMAKEPLLMLPDWTSRQKICTYYDYKFNHNFVFDLNLACGNLPGKSSEPVKESGCLQLIDLRTNYKSFFNVAFAQDSMKPCCRWTGKGWQLVEVACPHKAMLPPLVRGALGLRLDGGKGGGSGNGLNYGGNFLVSHPVSQNTAEISPSMTAMGWCGPVVMAHPPAPFGKIVVGDCSNGFASACLDSPVRARLLAEGQGAQPWLPIDVSWLEVGHVDEIVTFIDSARGPAMAIASPRAMKALLRELARLPHQKLRAFHVGKWGRESRDGGWATPEGVGEEGLSTYRELTLDDLFATSYDLANARLQREKLEPIRNRLEQGLALNPDLVIELPVYFEMVGLRAHARAKAATLNVVNMQIIGQALCIPTPCGPRVTPAEARNILERLLGRRVEIAPTTGFWHWSFPGEKPRRMALYYVLLKHALVHEKDIPDDFHDLRWACLSKETNYDRLPMKLSELKGLADALLDEVFEHALNRNENVWTNMESGKRWTRVWIPIPLVDIVEEYVKAAIGPGVAIHFVDTWEYHLRGGATHCATNGVSRPPEKWAAMIARYLPKHVYHYAA